VAENTESTATAVSFDSRAVVLGWPEERIVVIDSDLGQSGASAKDREGFTTGRRVGTGRAGIVMGLEVPAWRALPAIGTACSRFVP